MSLLLRKSGSPVPRDRWSNSLSSSRRSAININVNAVCRLSNLSSPRVCLIINVQLIMPARDYSTAIRNTQRSSALVLGNQTETELTGKKLGYPCRVVSELRCVKWGIRTDRRCSKKEAPKYFAKSAATCRVSQNFILEKTLLAGRARRSLAQTRSEQRAVGGRLHRLIQLIQLQQKALG